MILEILAIIFSFVSMLFASLTFFLCDRKIVKIEKARRDNEIEEKRKLSYLNRPQFKVVDYKFDTKSLGYKKENDFDIDVFFLPYESLDVNAEIYTPLYPKKKKTELDFIKEGLNHQYKKPICHYLDVYDKKNEWVSFELHLKNIGNSRIRFYYLLLEAERQGSIVDAKDARHYNTLKTFKGAEYVSVGKRNFIEIGDIIKIKINFHKDYILANSFSSPFALFLEAEDGTHWTQGIFLDPNQTLESHLVSNEEFTNYFQGYFLDAVMYDRIYWSKKNYKESNGDNFC